MTKHFNPRGKRGILAVRADVTGDVPELMKQLKTTFAEFKTANDERLDALEKGKADVVAEEKVDKINASISDIQAKIEDALKRTDDAMQKTEEARAGADEAMKAIGRLSVGGAGSSTEEIDALRANATAFYAAKTGKPIDEITDVDVEQYQNYRSAYSMFVRRGGADGERLPQDVMASLSSGSDADGGFWVPTEMASRIQTRLFETSDIRQIATVESTTADMWELPIDVNEAASGGWVSEKATRSETDTPRSGIQKIEIHEQFAEPKATQRVLDDATRNVEQWLGTKIADKFSRVENTAFVLGTGAGQPRGIFSYGADSVTTDDASRDWGKLQHVVSGAAGDFPAQSGIPGAKDPDALLTMISKLKPFYRNNARWLMSRATEAVIRKMKDGDGRYLVGMGDLRDAATGFMLLGFPVATAEDVPALAGDAYSIAFGDFSAGYTIVDRQGIRTLRDPYTGKPFVKFYSTKRVGADVTDFDAIKLMKMAA